MTKPKNYDSPFDREEAVDLEREVVLSSEQIKNTDYIEYDDNFPPKGSLLNIRAENFFPKNASPFSKKEESEAFIKYKKMENLK